MFFVLWTKLLLLLNETKVLRTMREIYNFLICCFSKLPFLFVVMNSILLSVFIFSCSSPAKNALLLYADSLMEERPDSALYILESMPVPQKLSPFDRALYALLLTQARHKNFVTLDNDSLIKTAVDYFGSRKKDFRAAQAHYYLGATYRDMGRTSFAVEEYLKAIQLMPEENEFLVMIYDNLAQSYEEEDLYSTAMDTYEKAYRICKVEAKRIFPLRGIAHTFLLQNQLDSALCYYQRAFDYALALQDSNSLAILNHDFAMIYEHKKDYIRANEKITRAIEMTRPDKLSYVYRTKGLIMFGMDELDSARYYFSKYKDQPDIYGRAICYNGLYQVEKIEGNWKAAVENANIYMALYDSIQELSDGKELVRLMDNYQLEEYKEELSQYTWRIVMALTITFFLIMASIGFWLLWKDRKRKEKYIVLQEELTQKRLDVMLLKDTADIEAEHAENQFTELREQQLKICMQMFQTTECYKKLLMMENSNPKQLLLMRSLIPLINRTIRNSFVDVMTNLKECCPTLTSDDLFYCILSLLRCSKNTIIELMDVTSDALKTRKSRIKGKMNIELFEYIYGSDNQ